MEIHVLSEKDIPAVLRIQQQAYLPQLLETADVFLNKLHLFPRGSLGSFAERQLQGYIFSHPWRRGDIVPLNQTIMSVPADADCIYIHDLAVSPKVHGRGIGRSLANEVFKIGHSLGIEDYTLIAVQNSESFWASFGFEPIDTQEYALGVTGVKMILRGSA